jgi:hypothetical protein
MAFVQTALLALVAVTGLLVASWVLGYNGLGAISGSELPASLRSAESNAIPSEPVFIEGTAGVATVEAANEVTGGIPAGDVRPGDGTSEFYGNQAFLSFWGLTMTQHAVWVGVRALPLLGMTLIWWLLFRIVRDVRRGAGFTRSTARRMTLIGLLVLLGVPLVQLARWEVAHWQVESSTGRGIAAAAGLRVDLWPLAVGLVILVIASTWQQAARMREDLEGLV